MIAAPPNILVAVTMGGREADGDKIQWARLNQPWFDRIVETLLMRKFRGVAEVDVVNGRGGDGGVDVSVTYPDGRLVIYQLKYYPEGMSGGFVGRRDKVKKSFVRAVKEQEPHEWVLVAPCSNFTNPEKGYIRRLPEAFTPAGKRRPTVGWMGRAELDQMLIDYPEVDRWLTLDHYRRTRQIFEQERTAFLDSPASDLANRVGALGDLIESRDPDWTWDFGYSAGSTVQVLRALNDNAAERSPISIDFGAAFEPDSAVGREFRRAMEYGSPARVEIPRAAITRFEVSGPDIVQGLPDPDRLVIESLPVDSPAVGMLMEIRFLEDGEVVATEEGTVTEVRHGTHGLTSVMSFCGGRLTVAAEIPYRATSGQTSSMGVGYKIHGLSPRSVAELFKVLLGLRTSKEVEFHIDGRFLTKYGRSSDEVDNEDPDFKEQLMVYRFAEDLAAVLAYTGQSMTFPNGFSGNDRVHARVARLLIEGHIVASPLARGVRARLPDSAELTQEIRNTLTERRHIHWPAGRYTAPIVGRNFDLGDSVAVHPETWVENGPAALDALERGEVSGDELIIRPGDDPYLFVYLTRTGPEDYADRWFARWDLDGIDEPWLDRPWLTPQDPEE
ncbi:hypothetical protein [Gordonia sp. NPDC003376]